MQIVRARRHLGDLARDLVRRAAPVRPAVDGWATRTLTGAMARAFLLATAAWQLVMLAAVVASPGPVRDLVPLLLAHAATLGAMLAARAGRLPAWVPVVAVYVLFVGGWSAADSMVDPLLFASCWMMNLGGATPAFVLRGRPALVLPALASVTVPAAMLLLRPDLPPTLPIAVFITQWSIVLATRVGLTYLFDFAAEADAEASAALRDRAAVAAQEAAGRAAAEDARVLHDTVINTLAAIASGGGAVRDTEAVRQRCARDIATVAALQAGTAPADDDTGLRAASYDSRVRVRHLGLDDARLAGAEARLDPARLRALRRATTELVQNAAKHAGVDEVRVRAEERAGELVVTVEDDGAGFDGRTGFTGGLATSVLDRAREAEIEVGLDTAPGAGTRVTLTVHRSSGAGPRRRERRGGIADVVRVLRRRACLLYGAGVSAVGFVLAVGNHPGEPTPEYLMATIAALGAALAWWCTRNRRALPAWAALVLAAAAPAAFVLSAAAVDYGRDDPVLWQAIGATGILIVLAELGPRPATVVWAGLGYAVVVLVVAADVGRSSPAAATIVLMAGAAALGLVAAWRRFQRTIGAIGVRAAADERAAWAARTQLAEREAADRSRGRWRAAGLNRSLSLLEAARDGADPDDPALRSRCAEEEAYLRQLTLLHPDLVHMGQWFARALNEAHDQGVRLVVRAGGEDLPAQVAADLGDLLLTTVAGTPTGQDLTITLFPSSAGARMTLVGAHPHLADGIRAARGPLAAATRVTSLADQDVAEIVVGA
ncbi:sensor histidine kinase [Nocardioides humi]|uniref:Histidine kinase/HSP90-like ATPase domain-containing protein n=1 Tax=Nocardioides humi TaxID=449461 RepID=A0ABN2AE73_9ACTN|nr:ATP-binding protein [Nocardioides humi]